MSDEHPGIAVAVLILGVVALLLFIRYLWGLES